MRSLCLLLWFALAFAPSAPAQTDPTLDRALASLAQAASRFWQSAPRFTAQETLKQKAILPSSKKRRLHMSVPSTAEPDPLTDREIVSAYAFSSYAQRSEAIHEFRAVISIDGKENMPPAQAWKTLKDAVLSSDDAPKRALAEKFQKANQGDTAVDFGQLILLFTQSRLTGYDFTPQKSEMIGADHTTVLSFTQKQGNAALHLNGSGKPQNARLTGQIWLREADLVPLRISLTTSSTTNDTFVRGDARVDYELKDSTLLPTAVIYRRYRNDDLRAEDIYQYADWRLLAQ